MQINHFMQSNSVFEKNYYSLNVTEEASSELKKTMGKLIASSIADDRNGKREYRTFAYFTFY